MNSRFIPSEEIEAVSHWQFGAVTGALERRHVGPKLTPEAAARLEQAREAGKALGREEVMTQAAQSVRQQMDDFYQRQGHVTAERLALCAQAFEARWAAAEQGLAKGVLELACALAREVVRRELTLDSKALEPVIREALGMMSTDAKAVTVRLNPQDFAVLEAALKESFAGENLMFRADPAVDPGGCLVEAAGMTVDGSLEKRWSRAVETLGLSIPWQEPTEAPSV